MTLCKTLDVTSSSVRPMASMVTPAVPMPKRVPAASSAVDTNQASMVGVTPNAGVAAEVPSWMPFARMALALGADCAVFAILVCGLVAVARQED